MARQVEPELTAWYVRRVALRDEMKAALVKAGDGSYPFDEVETAQYTALSQGLETPYPLSVTMETKLLQEMRALDTTTFTADDAIGITLQVNTLESFRRAYLSQKQTKRDLLRHLTDKLAQGSRYDDLMLQQFTATDKVL